MLAPRVDWLQPVNKDAPLNSGLVGWWMAGEGPFWGGPKMLDLLARSNGTLTNAPTWRGALGCPGAFGSLQFTDSSNTRVLIDDGAGQAPAALRITGPVTLVARFRKTSNSLGGLLGRGGSLDSASNCSYYLADFNSAVYLGVSNGTMVNTINASVLDNTNWFTAIGSWNGTNGTNGMRLYVNGNQVQAGDATITSLSDPASRPVWLGDDPVVNRGFNGYGVDFRIYNTFCDPAKAAAIHADAVSGYQATLNWYRPLRYFDLGGGGGGVSVPVLIGGKLVNNGILLTGLAR